MIYDGLSKLNRYRGLYKGLDVLIDWLDLHDMRELPTMNGTVAIWICKLIWKARSALKSRLVR